MIFSTLSSCLPDVIRLEQFASSVKVVHLSAKISSEVKFVWCSTHSLYLVTPVPSSTVHDLSSPGIVHRFIAEQLCCSKTLAGGSPTKETIPKYLGKVLINVVSSHQSPVLLLMKSTPRNQLIHSKKHQQMNELWIHLRLCQ